MKKRILHVSCGGLGHGGVSAVIFSIVENLYTKYDFDCVVFKKKCDREDKFLKYGNTYRINCYNDGKKSIVELIFRPFVMFWGIYKICKKNKYDIIHVHNNFEEGYCLFAAKLAGVKVRIAHSHNTASPKKEKFLIKLRAKINRYLVNKNATSKIGCSKAACMDYYASNDFKVIFNAIDLTKFKPNKNFDKKSLKFIHVGRYTYQKNQEFVIKVFLEILKLVDKAELHLVGFGEDEKKLKEMVTNFNIDKKVKFIPGNNVDIVNEYSKAQYMIFPSFFEGFGIVLIEAQAMGIHCYVSKEAIQKELDAGLLTFISLNKSPKEWAKIIMNDINNNKTDYSKVSKNLLKFSSDIITKQYYKLYGGESSD